ncbi:SH3 domain-containing protein [Chryseobacterium nematophagum]|uniref:SH3 domain-containing protein n=1 Tax=Chryseobacterium nematophagum TaxID=2305228 RepID=A0A3M7LC13_9FLAO|nr:SH3 domain-containing protein [Chryseobacterium nematophagum]RMZ59594.1 SH3 domain-containing protein [Chryseobacterium nematophagum]
MKSLIIYSIISSLLFISCNGQDKKNENQQLNNDKKMDVFKEAPYNKLDEGDGTKSNYDDLSFEFINKAKKILEQRKFQFLSDESFNQKILEIYGFNLKEYKNSIFVLRPSMFPEIALKKDKFIFLQDANTNDVDFVNPELLYHYNSYIFHNSSVSYVWLQAHYPEILNDLFIHYGYNKDKKLIESIFKKFNFNSLADVEELIFTDSNSGKFLKKQIFDDIETIIYKGRVEDFSYAKEGDGYIKIGEIIEKISSSPNEYIEPAKIIAYLFERELRVGIQGDIESYMNKNSQYQSNLEKSNFYELPTLKDYVKYVYQKNINDNIYTIQDPDGYTNLRKDKNTSSEVLQKIKSGEHIEVLDDSGDWYFVKTIEGEKGYVHKSRIKK